VAVYRTGDGSGPLAVGGNLSRTIEAIRLVVHLRAGVSIETHRPIAVVGVNRTLRLINRKRVVVDSEPIAVRVGIRDQPCLKHLVGGVTHARHKIFWFEGRLLDFLKVVYRVAIEDKLTYFDERIVSMWPNFCQI